MTLRAKHITLGYSQEGVEKQLQKGLDLVLEPGELVALVGPNGTGKSTLLKTLSGLISPLEGSVLIDDKTISSLTPAERSRKIALVLTERITQAHLTVEGLVSLGRYPYLDWLARQKTEDQEVIEESIRLCCLEDLKLQTLDRLSDGERQRAMIARAIAQSTPVIILDEPTAHLDLKSRVEVLLLLRNLARQTGKSIVVATHELELALNLADRLWVMPSKTQFLQGIPEELVLNGTLGSTFSSGQIEFDELTGSFRIKNPQNKKVTLIGTGIRAFWTSKALERIGYTIAENAERTVLLTDNGWKLENREYNSLSEMLIVIKK